jgi:hypothetical protein
MLPWFTDAIRPSAGLSLFDADNWLPFLQESPEEMLARVAKLVGPQWSAAGKEHQKGL